MAKNIDCDVEENLYGCYLLYCLNEKFKGQTYIGYTVNPLRRIRQHNNGVRAGGAKRTSNRGPWEMVLIIHGFPNSISALKFEWAWQHPNSSRHLGHVRRKRPKETTFQYRFYVVSEMLRVGPWKRLPLTVRWLKQEYVLEFDSTLRPPPHMPIVYGQVTSQKVTNEGPAQSSPTKGGYPRQTLSQNTCCALCKTQFKNVENHLRCLNPACRMESHMTCLADRFSGAGAILPVEGNCPGCGCTLLWGDLIKYKKGCYKHLSATDEDDSDDHWSAALHQ